jgi:hypothetical protein
MESAASRSMKNKRKTNTTQIELVETYNLYLSLNRVYNSSPYDSEKWKRALYHAISMTSCATREMRVKIREALELA